MNVEQLDRWCERGIMLLVVAMIAFAVLAFGAVGGLEWQVVQGLMLAVLGLWGVRLWCRPGHRFLCLPITWAVLAFTIYTAVQWNHAEIEFAARSELLKVVVYAFLFLAVVDNLHGQDTAQTLIFSLVFLGMLVSMYAVYQFITDSPFVWNVRKPPAYAHRGSGTFICPNHLAGFLEMVLPLSLAFVLSGRAKHGLKVFLGYAGLVMLAGLAVTVSRGGWIAAGVGLLVFFALLLRNRSLRLPIFLVLALIAGGIVFFARNAYQPQKRLDQLVENDSFKDVRFQLWKPAVQVWQDNFWWGAGPGHFDHAFRKYRPRDIQMRPLYAHNDYLNVLADYGLAGLLIVLGVLALFVHGVIRTWKFVQRSSELSSKPSNRVALVLGGAAGLLAMAVHSVFDFNMHIPANALTAVVIMAIVASHLRFATERFWMNPGLFGRVAATAVIMAALAGLGQQTVAGMGQQLLVRRASNAPDTDAKVALLKEAHRRDPGNFELVGEIGEIRRLQSWEGNPGYEALAQDAMTWFELGMKLNPLDPYNFARYGMCLDWLGKGTEAEPYFRKAVELDPQNYYILGLMGWHHFHNAEYAASREWFEKSRHFSLWRLDAEVRDAFPALYLRAIERKLQERVNE